MLTKLPFHKASEPAELYQLILANALDAFIAIGPDSRIIEWSAQAAAMFGWNKEEILGRTITETIIPQRYREAHLAGMRHFSATGEGRFLNRRVEVTAQCRNGTEFPVELSITPVETGGSMCFFASLRDLSASKALEEEIQRQSSITASILHCMAGAVIVSDLDGQLILINPAGQRLLNLKPVEDDSRQTIDSITFYLEDGKTECLGDMRPTRRALRGEHVDGFIGLIRHEGLPGGVWVSVNARPLLDRNEVLLGAVVAFHDISELRTRAEERERQSRLLQEQASLLDLTHDAILARTIDDVITYWNLSASRLYGFSREEAIGQVSTALLKTRFPVPIEAIRAELNENHYWEGELVHTTKDGRELIVFSEWALEFHEGRPYRYLETNTDITHQVQTERALRQSQEDLRLMVEASTDHAIIMIDPEGAIRSWNSGAERIFGIAAQEAIGLPHTCLFTPEDREMGEPLRELEEARTIGRSDDDRWHVRKDGTRFWASGVVTPLRNADGSLRGYTKIMRDQTAQRIAEEQTRYLANHDALTGMPNRVNFSNRLHQSLALSQRNNVPMALLLLDLDRFKHVNDTFGHHTGDLLLKEVAQRILSSLRETDFVARLGGDEFVIIQSDVSQPDAAETLARKLVLELGRPYSLEDQEVFSGTSIGICVYPTDAKNSVELLKRADLALYRAKNAGRHTFQCYTDELITEHDGRKGRENALRTALQNHQFEMYYQPQVDLRTWKINTVEALLRWNANPLETILPADFLDIAEQSGLIVEIGEWALREAGHQVRRWQMQGLSDLKLSVNCSARQFNDPMFVKRVPSILADVGIAPESLEIEIPEAMLAQHPEIKERLAELRTLGIRLTIDNFGTGATALIDLKGVGIDVIKIDKAFVQHLPHRREDSAIAAAIISLAHHLGISVVAGGVETAEQLAYLKARDCTSAQGFIFSPPVPAEQFEALVLDGAWSRMNRMQPFPDGATPGKLH